MQIVRLWPLGSLAPGAGGSKRAGLTQIVRPALLLGFGPLRLDIDILRLDIDILRPDIDILRPYQYYEARYQYFDVKGAKA